MYVHIVIDLLNRKLDRPFTYAVPKELEQNVSVGTPVLVPFGKGSRLRRGYVLRVLSEVPDEGYTIREIDSVPEKAVGIQEQMIMLALKMRDLYGGTIYQALSVVLPAKQETGRKLKRDMVFTGSTEELESELAIAERRKYYARIRLLRAFRERQVLPGEVVTDRLSIPSSALKYFTEKGLVEIRARDRNPGEHFGSAFHPGKAPELNPEQKNAVDGILSDNRRVHLLYGITGSGKTEVYLHLIDACLKAGREAVVLIPEIALTYQTVLRFYERFGDLVSVVHSRLSKGEKYERFHQAEEGNIKVMIGPRSALFTPFRNLGLIIMDEFHETSYLSEQVPKYDTEEVAEMRAELSGAKLVLGSATPSVAAWKRAAEGEFGLYRLSKRAVPSSRLPKVILADMREELQSGNRSVFSRVLSEKIQDRLDRKEQIMLFLNRRGYSGAVSCRSCGKPIVCPHCSVALKYHRNHTLKCHICGDERPMDRVCPYCGSSKIGAFGLGTEKLEEYVREQFPGVRTLRMDADTTAGKEGHREILEKFGLGEADILIGTQMIVKGHDFPNVTLVGIIAADLSLNVPDYRSSERTFQLLLQAEGRAGRAGREGECVIQTYMPDHYAVQCAARNDFEGFYEQEMLYRSQMLYPPCGVFQGLMFSGPDSGLVSSAMEKAASEIRRIFPEKVRFLGPSEAGIYKVRDMYREIIYVKTADERTMHDVRQELERICASCTDGKRVYASFER